MVSTWIEETIGLSTGVQSLILRSLVALLVSWIAYRVALLLIGRRVRDAEVAYRWHKAAGYVVWLFIALAALVIWVDGLGSLVTYLGLVSAGVAIALQSLLQDMAGGLLILLRRPCQVGERIEIGGMVGDVIDLRPFQFSLLEVANWVNGEQSTGRIMHVPNGTVFREVVANYTAEFDFIWTELAVLLTFESNWELARELLNQIANRHAVDAPIEAERQISKTHRFYIRYGNLTPRVYLTVRDSGVELCLRTLCEPRKRRHLEQELWVDILRTFSQHDDIDFAYPTLRVFDNVVEGASAGADSDTRRSRH